MAKVSLDDNARILHSQILDIKSKLLYRTQHPSTHIPWERPVSIEPPRSSCDARSFSERESYMNKRERELQQRKASLFKDLSTHEEHVSKQETRTPERQQPIQKRLQERSIPRSTPIVSHSEQDEPTLGSKRQERPEVQLFETQRTLVTKAIAPPLPPKPRVIVTSSVGSMAVSAVELFVAEAPLLAVFPQAPRKSVQTAAVQCTMQEAPSKPEQSDRSEFMLPKFSPDIQQEPVQSVARAESTKVDAPLTQPPALEQDAPLKVPEVTPYPTPDSHPVQTASQAQAQATPPPASVEEEETWAAMEKEALLSGEWQQRKDKASNRNYYLHKITKQTIWNLRKHFKETRKPTLAAVPALPVPSNPPPSTPATESDFFPTNSAASIPSDVQKEPSSPLLPIEPTKEQVEDEIARVISKGIWIEKASTKGKSYYLNKKDKRVSDKTVWDLRATLKKALMA
eukprot:TRINITY_DN1971_c0_g1_i1.p1 TRINITY_DN1971_c0_g1~~TRINITY_DN1971_c0_g1_i1.p1  ORF type:complete len:456 (+),score=70.84 TRINITY_DN1971_c0_g1_i1:728-2095(+)